MKKLTLKLQRQMMERLRIRQLAEILGPIAQRECEAELRAQLYRRK